jgi:hypothetical protein
MEPEKNLHASIPNALLMEAQKIAEAQNVTVDELVRDAMERRLREIRRQKLRAYGEAQARKLGVSDDESVERIVHEFRDEERARNNGERGR